MEDNGESGSLNEYDADIERSTEFHSKDRNGGNSRDFELRGLNDKVVRSIKYRNSPIVHRRSRFEELLSIPDVAAALSNSEENVDSVTVKLRNKEQKPAVRPPSPAYLGPPLPDSAGEDTPTEHFSFNFENRELYEGGSLTNETEAVLTGDNAEPQTENVDVSTTRYDIIADSLGPIESALTTDSQTTMVGHRLSLTSSALFEEGIGLSEESPLDEDNETIPENFDDREYVEDYFDTYNRPSIRERRIQDKNRLSKNKEDYQVTALTWRSLARAIARVQSLSSDKESSILKAEQDIIPILKITVSIHLCCILGSHQIVVQTKQLKLSAIYN